MPSTWEKFWRPKMCLPLERREAAACRAFDRKQFEGCTVFSHFVPIHRTNYVGQAQSCLPAASDKKGTLRTVRLLRKDLSQVRPWILILDWRCSWTKSLRRSRSFAACFWFYRLHGVISAKMWLLFARSNFHCLSETAWKARQALVSLALFSFFSFSLKKASARFSKCASRDPGTRCGRTRPDCLFAINACQITCKALPVNFRSRQRGSLASRLGAGVNTAWDLSKLKSRCRSVTALSIKQRGFFSGVELSGPSQVLENVELFRK